MAGINIKNIPNATSLSTEDFVIVEQTTGTKKTSINDLTKTGTVVHYSENPDTIVLQKPDMIEKVNNMQDDITKVSSQLEKKANNVEVIKKGYGTLSDFDESTRATLLGLEQGQINAVLGERNVISENIGLDVIKNEHISKEITDGILTKKFTTQGSGTYENASALQYHFTIPSTIVSNVKVKFKSVSLSDNNDNIRIKVALVDIASNLKSSSLKEFVGTVELSDSFDYSNITTTDVYVYVWVAAKDISKQSSYCVYDLELEINNNIIPTQYTLLPYNIGSMNYTISDYYIEPKLFSYDKGLELKEGIEFLTKKIVNEVKENIEISAKANNLNLIQLELIFNVKDKSSFNLYFKIKDNPSITKLGSRIFLNDVSTGTSVSGVQIGANYIENVSEYSRTITNNTSSYAHIYLEFGVSDLSALQNITITDYYIYTEGVITKYNGEMYLYRKNDTDTVKIVQINSSDLVTHEQLNNEIVKVNENIKNRLYGKKIVGIGDSMVQGHSIPKDKGWLAMISNRNNMTYINYGINGTYLTNKLYGVNKGVVERYIDMDDDADYIVVYAGTNDGANGVVIGDDDSINPAEFKGALNILCDGLITKYPKGKIMFITPYLRNSNYENYINAIEKICSKYGIRVFNNMKNGGICWSNSAQVQALTLGDTYHLNLDGMEYASYKYEEELKRL